MKILEKNKTQENIEKIESGAESFLRAISSAIFSLNSSYKFFWGLPDDELTSVLQHLVNIGKLEEILTKHRTAANNLNEIQDEGDYVGERAIAIIGREFTVSPDGVVSLVMPAVIEMEESN